LQYFFATLNWEFSSFSSVCGLVPLVTVPVQEREKTHSHSFDIASFHSIFHPKKAL
jgi:hypothetical protein